MRTDLRGFTGTWRVTCIPPSARTLFSGTTMSLKDRADQALRAVSNNPEVLRGQTVFAGTGVLLDALRDYRHKGRSIDEFLLDFPSVEPWQAQVVWGMDDADITRLIQRSSARSGGCSR